MKIFGIEDVIKVIVCLAIIILLSMILCNEKTVRAQGKDQILTIHSVTGLNLHDVPGMSKSKKIGIIYPGYAYKVTETFAHWAEVEIDGNVKFKRGWITTEVIVVNGNGTWIGGEGCTLRVGPSKTTKDLVHLVNGTKITVKQSKVSWYKIECPDIEKSVGWVWAGYSNVK